MGLSNIPIGAGKITFLGVDLGWTSGSITMSVEEKVTEIKVDSWAQQVLDERIYGTAVKFKVPLAEGGLLTLMESIFAGRTCEIGDILYNLKTGIGIDRYLYAGPLVLELLTSETDVEAGNTPNKYYYHKAQAKGAVTITYSGWDQQVVYEFEIEVYPTVRESGTGTGALNTFTKTTPATAWVADMWNGFVLTDSAGAKFVIQDTSTTALTVIGTPATGTYTIEPTTKAAWGTGTGTLNTWTKTTPSANWTVNEWVGYTLTDDAAVEFVISANDATTLTVAGTPTTGDYTITVGAGKGAPSLGYRGKV